MRNGVIAIHRDGSLALMNDEAYRIFAVTRRPDHPGQPFADVLRERPSIIRVLSGAFELSHLPNRAELRLNDLDRVIGYTLSQVKDDKGGFQTVDLRKSPRFSARTLHLMTETMRRAYCDRARHLGDQDFMKIPAHLTSKEYAKKLAAGIEENNATPSEAIAKDIPLTDTKTNTTHYSVIDTAGMAVSTTTTLEDSFGSKVVVRGAGFLLNNEMTDFNPRPGVTTKTGLVGTTPNQIAPGKRMLSSMTPVIVCRDGRVVLVTGSPGGRTIINTVLCVVLNVLEFEMPLREALDAPRMHMQWFPDRLQLEPGYFDEHKKTVEALEAMGHKAVKVNAQGDAHSIWLDPKTKAYRGEHDRRRASRPQTRSSP